jgi:hypothetical protein
MEFDKLSEELIQQASKAIPAALTALVKVGRHWANARDLLNHTNEYRDRLEADCSQMQILGMEQPIPLDDVYTEVRIVNRVQSRMFKTIAELEAEARRAVERRSLSSIEEKIRERLTTAIRKERQQAAATNVNEEFRLKFEELTTEQNQRFHKIYPNCQESLDTALATLRHDYDLRVANLRAATAAEKEYKDRQKDEKAALRNRFANLIFPNQASKDEELEAQQLEAEVQQATEALAAIEDNYRDLCLAYESKLRKLKAEKRQATRALQRELEGTPLTRDEERKLATQLPVDVEKELKDATRRELTQRVFDDFGHATRSDEQPEPAWQAIAKKSRSLVLGQPGAGKTTFLKFIVLQHLRETTAQPKLPILITLRGFATSGCERLLDFIAQGFSDCGFPNADAFIERLLDSKHKCILLFDGLDEVNHSQQEDVVNQIVRISKRYRHNQFVVSCRTANFKGQLEGFTEFEIAEFGHEQVATFVSGWFSENRTLADDFLLEIKRHSGLAELTATPLLLALLCIGYRRNQRFPAQKALVYLASIDALLVDWDSSKQLRRESFVSNFDSESKKQLLAKVACDTFCEESLFFSPAEIVSLFDEDSSSFPIEAKTGDRILDEYVENHGLIVERARGIYSFSHLTLQEFLAALHLSRNQPVSVLERLTEEAWADARWKETVVFLAGLLPRADTFVVCIRNQLKSQIAESAIRLLFVPRELPPSAIYYIARPKTKGDRESWTAWFRWRLFEYRLHEASYGTEQAGIATRLGMLNISVLVAQALGLAQGLGHPLALDRPLNAAVAASFSELQKPGTSDLMTSGENTLTSYLSLVGMLVEILASGVKIENALRKEVLFDIAQPASEKWPYPTPSRSNRLGA